jgi:hypothetical protein
MKIEVEKNVLKAAVNDLDESLQIMRAFRNKEVRVCDIEKLASSGARKIVHARYKIHKLLGKDASI